MSVSRTVLVTGASGQQGHAVAEALLAGGHKVLAFTRNPDSATIQGLVAKGAEVRIGDFEDGAGFAPAAQGADTAFLMGSPIERGVEAETRQGIVAADAIKAAGVGHLIYSSVGSADRDTGIPHFDSKYGVEKHIAGLGVPFTISAPVTFMDNVVAPWSIESLRKGVLDFPVPGNRNVQFVAVADIGSFVASLVGRREAVFGHRYDIAGDELTGTRQAEILSEAIGRPITYNGIPPAVVRQYQGEDQARMAEWFDAVGYSADIPSLRRDFSEVGWQRYADWARQQNWSALAEPAKSG
ncbi:MAG: NmrA-like family protein [Devosia sp.]|uniref:NmrA/HSCARG family protein n=1 Tax=Devosia sp. TaxID=1871048 RepID=UPI00260AE931|nr:NmrA/HSCARG family protein [Devosia sp.]MDB5540215.1 NmrA-like family protein [Devosia sp.]